MTFFCRKVFFDLRAVLVRLGRCCVPCERSLRDVLSPRSAARF